MVDDLGLDVWTEVLYKVFVFDVSEGQLMTVFENLGTKTAGSEELHRLVRVDALDVVVASSDITFGDYKETFLADGGYFVEEVGVLFEEDVFFFL